MPTAKTNTADSEEIFTVKINLSNEERRLLMSHIYMYIITISPVNNAKMKQEGHFILLEIPKVLHIDS